MSGGNQCDRIQEAINLVSSMVKSGCDITTSKAAPSVMSFEFKPPADTTTTSITNSLSVSASKVNTNTDPKPPPSTINNNTGIGMNVGTTLKQGDMVLMDPVGMRRFMGMSLDDVDHTPWKGGQFLGKDMPDVSFCAMAAAAKGLSLFGVQFLGGSLHCWASNDMRQVMSGAGSVLAEGRPLDKNGKVVGTEREFAVYSM